MLLARLCLVLGLGLFACAREVDWSEKTTEFGIRYAAKVIKKIEWTDNGLTKELNVGDQVLMCLEDYLGGWRWKVWPTDCPLTFFYEYTSTHTEEYFERLRPYRENNVYWTNEQIAGRLFNDETKDITITKAMFNDSFPSIDEKEFQCYRKVTNKNGYGISIQCNDIKANENHNQFNGEVWWDSLPLTLTRHKKEFGMGKSDIIRQNTFYIDHGFHCFPLGGVYFESAGWRLYIVKDVSNHRHPKYGLMLDYMPHDAVRVQVDAFNSALQPAARFRMSLDNLKWEDEKASTHWQLDDFSEVAKQCNVEGTRTYIGLQLQRSSISGAEVGRRAELNTKRYKRSHKVAVGANVTIKFVWGKSKGRRTRVLVIADDGTKLTVGPDELDLLPQTIPIAKRKPSKSIAEPVRDSESNVDYKGWGFIDSSLASENALSGRRGELNQNTKSEPVYKSEFKAGQQIISTTWAFWRYGTYWVGTLESPSTEKGDWNENRHRWVVNWEFRHDGKKIVKDIPDNRKRDVISEKNFMLYKERPQKADERYFKKRAGMKASI